MKPTLPIFAAVLANTFTSVSLWSTVKDFTFHPTLELNFSYEDNVSNGYRAIDEFSDYAGGIDLAFDYKHQLNHQQALGLKLIAASTWQGEFSDLNEQTLGVAIEWGNKWGLGNEAWRLTPFAGFNYSHVEDENLNATAVSLGIRLDKPINSRTHCSLSYDYTHDDAKSFIYDREHHDVELSLSYLVRPDWELTGSYAYKNGDITAYQKLTPGSAPAAPFLTVNTFKEPLIAFRSHGETHQSHLQLNYYISEATLCSIQYEFEKGIYAERNFTSHQYTFVYGYVF